jgi:hypothetical protein
MTNMTPQPVLDILKKLDATDKGKAELASHCCLWWDLHGLLSWDRHDPIRSDPTRLDSTRLSP